MPNELSGPNAGAIAFATMPDDQLTVVLEDLQRLPLALSTADELFELIRGHNLLNTVDGEYDEESGPGSFILFAFYRMADRGSKTLAQIIDGFVARVGREITGAPSSEELISSLRVRLEKISRLEGVITSIKAVLLNAERDKLFLSGRVITDARPVFDDDTSSASMLVINTLKMEVREGAEKRVSYISLDKKDIDDLIEQLERARRKSDMIAMSLKASQIKVIE